MRDRRDAQPDAGPWSEGRLEYVSPAKSFGRESTMLQGVARNQTAPVRWRSVEGGARYEATLAEPEQWLPRRQRFKVALCTPFSSSPAPPVASFFSMALPMQPTYDYQSCWSSAAEGRTATWPRAPRAGALGGTTIRGRR